MAVKSDGGSGETGRRDRGMKRHKAGNPLPIAREPCRFKSCLPHYRDRIKSIGGIVVAIDREGFFTPQITRAVLDNLKLALDRRVSTDIFFQGRVHERIEPIASMFGEMMVELTAVVLGKEHIETVVIKTPADWWEGAKERFLPELFKLHYPVVYSEQRIAVKVFRTCPHLKPEPTARHVYFAIAKEGADRVKVNFEEYEAFMGWKKKGMPEYVQPKAYRWLEGKGGLLVPYEKPPIRARLAHFVRRNLLSPNAR
jgi:hypothetical protein